MTERILIDERGSAFDLAAVVAIQPNTHDGCTLHMVGGQYLDSPLHVDNAIGAWRMYLAKPDTPPALVPFMTLAKNYMNEAFGKIPMAADIPNFSDFPLTPPAPAIGEATPDSQLGQD